jgi:hypothetical protein
MRYRSRACSSWSCLTTPTLPAAEALAIANVLHLDISAAAALNTVRAVVGTMYC